MGLGDLQKFVLDYLISFSYSMITTFYGDDWINNRSKKSINKEYANFQILRAVRL